jgi:hypothetical protein
LTWPTDIFYCWITDWIRINKRYLVKNTSHPKYSTKPKNSPRHHIVPFISRDWWLFLLEITSVFTRFIWFAINQHPIVNNNKEVEMIPEDIRKTIKSRYDKLAETGGNTESCWPSKQQPSSGFAVDQGLYTDESLSSIPEIARNLSRGCGNPIGYATLHAGDVVVDFGCGGGIDVILAAQKVGSQGKVVGIDFAPQMIDQAKRAIIAAGLKDYAIDIATTLLYL